MKYLIISILLLTLNSCKDKEIILIQLTPDKFIINNKEIKKDEFESELKTIIDNKIKLGLEKSDMTIHVKADKKMTKDEMSKIEQAIRRQGMTRDYFWTE